MNQPKHRLPALEPSKNACHSPHVVLLGAGASLAAFPNGDANGRSLPVMKDFVEVVGLESVLDDLGVSWRGRDFEEVLSELIGTEGSEASVAEIERTIYDYFAGLSLPDEVTLYDELLLSLRDKDLIASFNWDPFLLQAYRRNLAIRRLSRIIFLHGNVSVGQCVKDRCKGPVGAPCAECGESLSPVRLLYPVTEKNYQDPFITGEWEEFSSSLEHAYLFTIFGYGAPAADIEARQIMMEVGNRTSRRNSLRSVSSTSSLKTNCARPGSHSSCMTTTVYRPHWTTPNSSPIPAEAATPSRWLPSNKAHARTIDGTPTPDG